MKMTMGAVSFQHLSNWHDACFSNSETAEVRETFKGLQNGDASMHVCPLGEAVHSSRSTIGLQVTISLKESACFIRQQERVSELLSKRIP